MIGNQPCDLSISQYHDWKPTLWPAYFTMSWLETNLMTRLFHNVIIGNQPDDLPISQCHDWKPTVADNYTLIHSHLFTTKD